MRLTEIISFFDIVHRLFLMIQDVSVAGSVSRFVRFAVTSLGQDMLSGTHLNKLTDPWCSVTDKGSIWGVQKSRSLPCLKVEAQDTSKTSCFNKNCKKETSRKRKIVSVTLCLVNLKCKQHLPMVCVPTHSRRQKDALLGIRRYPQATRRQT
jgi:hypothetical protein